MKFEIEISEELIQERLNIIAGYDKRYGEPSLGLRVIIDEAVKHAIASKLKESFPMPDSLNVIINSEIEKAAAAKVPGWAKRRMKEMLDAVRLSQIYAKED